MGSEAWDNVYTWVDGLTGCKHLLVMAMGIIESNRDAGVRSNAHVINQLVSSAIVNVPPLAAVVWFYEKIGDTVEKVDRGITAQLLTFPATDHRFIGKRNYFSLSLDDKRRIGADWFVEDEDDPLYESHSRGRC